MSDGFRILLGPKRPVTAAAATKASLDKNERFLKGKLKVILANSWGKMASQKHSNPKSTSLILLMGRSDDSLTMRG